MNSLQICCVGVLILLTVFILLLKPKPETNKLSVRKITTMAMLLAMAVALGLIETIYVGFFVPGFRLGLANIIILLALYGMGIKEALIIDILKVVIVSLVRGNIFSMGGMMGLAGALLSFLVMALSKLAFKRLSPIGISILGALFHDVGQIVVALLYLSNPAVFYYLPFMALISLLSGTLLGLLASLLLKRNIFAFNSKKANP